MYSRLGGWISISFVTKNAISVNSGMLRVNDYFLSKINNMLLIYVFIEMCNIFKYFLVFAEF